MRDKDSGVARGVGDPRGHGPSPNRKTRGPNYRVFKRGGEGGGAGGHAPPSGVIEKKN